MLQFINDLPDNVVGIHAIGEVTKEDYDKVLIPKIEELVARQGQINYLLVLETDVQNFSAASWLADFKLGLKHFTQWNKIAVVTDQKGVSWFTDVFRFFIPGKSKGFSLDQLDEATKWISEKESDDEPVKTDVQPSDNDKVEPELVTSSNKGQGPAGENL